MRTEGRDRVETEGWETEDGSQEPGTGDNVVPFPRDWLGPREELIPFGSSAGHSSEEGTCAPGAEAFWGGDPGPLHAVLPALPGGPGAASAATAAAGWRLRRRAGRLAAAGLLAAVLAAAAFGRLAGVPTTGSEPAVGSNVAAADFMDLALLRGAVGMPDIRPSKPAVHKPAQRRARTAARVKRPTQSLAATSSSTVPAAQTSEPRSTSSAGTSATSSAGTSTTSTSGTVSSGSTSTGSSEPAATSTAPTHQSVSSHTASVHAGPVGPGAPFGPGQLK